MSVKLCFYCKAFITSVKKLDGIILYANEAPDSPEKTLNIEQEATAREEDEEASSNYETPPSATRSRDTQTSIHDNNQDETSN